MHDPVLIPVSGAFEPVKDVGAAGVVDLVKWMGVRLLHSHCITTGTEKNHHLNQNTYMNNSISNSGQIHKPAFSTIT